MEIGRICVKTAGRDAGRVCVVVDQLDGNFVLVDGDVRRKKCNMHHLEPLGECLKIKKGASHTEVATEFKKLGLNTWQTKPKQKAARQKSKRAAEKEAKKQTKTTKQAESASKTEKPAKETAKSVKAEKPQIEKKEVKEKIEKKETKKK